MEEKLKIFASTDDLTDIFNRRTGLALLEKYINETKINNNRVTIFFIDIDNLKAVNDTYGHKEGDELIITTVGLIKRGLRKSDILCRFGGDEFLMILPDCEVEEAERVWQRINKELDAFNARRVKPYIVGLSHGCAQYDPSGELSVDKLVAVADQEMYKEKVQNKLKIKAGGAIGEIL